MQNAAKGVIRWRLFAFVCSFVFNIDYSEFSEKGMIYLIFVILLMYVLFFIYDFLLAVMTKLYILKVKDRIRKLFK